MFIQKNIIYLRIDDFQIQYAREEMGIRTNGKTFSVFSTEKNKMGSSAVNILGKTNNFLVAKPRHAKTSTESGFFFVIFNIFKQCDL